MQRTKTTLKTILIILVVIAAIPVLFFVYTAITDYRPMAYVTQIRNFNTQASVPDTLCLMSWNIGYAGLGANSDFFFDGGSMMRPDEKTLVKSLVKIKKRIQSSDSVHIILLQEVDSFARRSYFNNEITFLQQGTSFSNFWFTKNYDVKFVPIPFHNPMGRVVAGLLTMSKFEARHVARYALQGEFSYPKQWFMLDRCFSVLRFKTQYSGDLVVINTHNTAFDDGNIRLQQITQLKNFMQFEYEKGNFIIAGGDFNINPPGYKIPFNNTYNIHPEGPGIPETFFKPGWSVVYDAETPTNRYLNELYKVGQTKTTLIDFFIISPNIKLLQRYTAPLNFIDSDHNPIYVKITLNPLYHE